MVVGSRDGRRSESNRKNDDYVEMDDTGASDGVGLC
jgi:hypothetical protein